MTKGPCAAEECDDDGSDGSEGDGDLLEWKKSAVFKSVTVKSTTKHMKRRVLLLTFCVYGGPVNTSERASDHKDTDLINVYIIA